MLSLGHGGDVYSHAAALDFSANLNPLGMPQKVRDALTAVDHRWEQYPDPFCRRLREKLSRWEGIPPEQIVCGNGAVELIYKIIGVLRPRKAVLCVPTFSEYEKALREQGCPVRRYRLKEAAGFPFDEGLLDLLDRDVDLLILCHPNNPTGRCVPEGLLAQIAKRCREKGIALLCDECFLGFVENGTARSFRRCLFPGGILLRAFTKLYAMAGVRLGYALFGDGALAKAVQEAGPCWSVSVPAQIAGEAALETDGYREKTVAAVTAERSYLAEQLASFGFTVYPAEANFLLFRCAAPLDELLQKDGILIRNCANFVGLGRGFFRTAVRSHGENTALVAAIRRRFYGEIHHDPGNDV